MTEDLQARAVTVAASNGADLMRRLAVETAFKPSKNVTRVPTVPTCLARDVGVVHRVVAERLCLSVYGSDVLQAHTAAG